MPFREAFSDRLSALHTGRMTTWEYVAILWSERGTWSGAGGHAGLQDMLETQGADGWELVSVLQGPTGEQHVAYLKRPK